MSRTLRVYRLGRVEYEDGLNLQDAFVAARRAGAVPDVLLLLEHPPVLTLGCAASRSNVLASSEVLAQAGVDLFATDRGGDVTWHGPRQVVGYPLVSLAPDRCDVPRYVRDLEETMIRTLADFGLAAGRIPRWNGVWLGSREKGDARKIGAVGVHIARWITSHGFALNVDPDLSFFDLIVPCGIRDGGVTSMARELGHAPVIEAVEASLAKHLAEVFGAGMEEGEVAHRTISVVVTRRAARPEVLLLRRREERGGFWQPVTGRVEAGEVAATAAARELGEETGLRLDVRPLGYRHAFVMDRVPTGDVPEVYEEEAFTADATDACAVSVDPAEHAEFAWVQAEDAAGLVPHAGLRRAIRLSAGRG